MKRIISILLASVIMLASVACLNVSAFETDRSCAVTYYDFSLLADQCNSYWYGLGFERPFGGSSVSRMYGLVDRANSITNGEYIATDEEIQTLYYDLWDQANNITVAVDYAYLSYEKACKEENFGNFYSEEDWNSFVQKRESLKATMDTYYDISRLENGLIKVSYIGPEDSGETAQIAVSDAFYAMLGQYNVMTNKYTVIGDVDKDGDVNVKDVTLIQKYLAKLEDLTGAQIMLAGSKKYNYESLTVEQATEIQKKIARLSDAELGDGMFIPKDGCFESYERRMERTFNYIICPRAYNFPEGIGNIGTGFYDTQYLESQMDYYNSVVAKNQ